MFKRYSKNLLCHPVDRAKSKAYIEFIDFIGLNALWNYDDRLLREIF
ncbi:MAG: hypothetical protein ACI9J4_001286 [Paraglaciecola sp.]|jgi:hypothetical protein